MNDTHRDIYRFNDNKTFITKTMTKAAALSSGSSLSLRYEEVEVRTVPEDRKKDGSTDDVFLLSARLLRIMDKIQEMRNRVGRFRLRLRKGPRYLEILHVNF
ncbi:hypothetical protein V8C44DRAFT_365582 [Trichoderma aethiopicum]